jgi:DNA-binding SARP family transcriptional activator
VDLTLFEARSRQAKIARSAGDTTQASMLLYAALSLWHGHPLAGVRGEFVEPERVRMEELRLAAFEERITLDLELGKSQELVTELIGLVNAHPFRERLSELLMLALYRAGRQADALHAYQRIATLLRRELAIEAGPGLRAQHLKILHSEEGLRCSSADCGRGGSKHT